MSADLANPEFEMVLDECLAQLDRGESLAATLGDHMALADELRPLMAVASGLRAAPPPRASAQAVADGKQKMLAAFAAQARPQLAPAPASTGFANRILAFLGLGKVTDAKYALRFAVGILLVLVFGTSGVLAAASTGSLPGDALYPVKQSVEGLRLTLTLDGQARQSLTDQLNTERLREIQSLLALHRQGTLEFDGLLQAQEGDQWTVSGLRLLLGDATIIEGWPAVGTRVRVLVQVGSDGTLTALRVRLAGPGIGAQGGGYSSPSATPSHVPTATPTPSERQNATPQPGSWMPDGPMSSSSQMHGPWPGDWQSYGPIPTGWPGHDSMSGSWETDHAMTTPWLMQGAMSTPQPAHDSMSTDQANPTTWPTGSSMMTPEPPRQSAPTQPAHQWMPTSQPPHRDGETIPSQPPHRDYQHGSGGDSGRRH